MRLSRRRRGEYGRAFNGPTAVAAKKESKKWAE
jgi:hypothetical protein